MSIKNVTDTYENPNINNYRFFAEMPVSELEMLGIYMYHNFLFKAPEDMADRMKKNTYEKEEINMILSTIPHKLFKDLNVIEIGGCLGVVSVISNHLLVNKKNHVIIEANPELLPILEFNKKINNSCFNIEHCIISKNDNSTKFKVYDKVVAGSAHRRDNRESNERIYNVKNKTLESLVNKYCTFDCIIIDIEGGELDFLIENTDYIRNQVKYIIIEIHEFLMYKGFKQKCLEILQNNCNMNLINKNGISFLFGKKKS